MNKLERDLHFLKLAQEEADKSKELGTHVGCVIVDKEGNVISGGCNDYIVNSNNEYLEGDMSARRLLSVHAEMNAMLKLVHSNKNLDGCIAYTTHASCENCLKHLITIGIKEVIYAKSATNNKFINEEMRIAIIRMMKDNNIIHRNVNGSSFEDDTTIFD